MATLSQRLGALEQRKSTLSASARWEAWQRLEIHLAAERDGEQVTLGRYRLDSLPPPVSEAIKAELFREITPADVAEARAKLVKLGARHALA